MNGKLYWKQKIPLLFLNGIGMAALTIFLWLNGINTNSMILILVVFGVTLAGIFLGAYFFRKAQMDKLLVLAEQLEECYLLRQYNVQIDLAETDDSVYSDEKWLCFILNQIIVNAVKYRTESPSIQFFVEHTGNEVALCIADNGIGICESDLPRIFEKGFTGENGRNVSQIATGIGLYLCRRLCDKLGIGLTAASNEKTIFRLSFDINDHIHQVQS